MARILVVDDSATMRQMVAFTLKSAGHDVVDAGNGQEALGKAESSRFALVISDLNMPGMDGLELTRKLRLSAANRTVPILLLTTESSGDRKAEGKSAGATGWLVKPFAPEKLLETVAKVVN